LLKWSRESVKKRGSRIEGYGGPAEETLSWRDGDFGYLNTDDACGVLMILLRGHSDEESLPGPSQQADVSDRYAIKRIYMIREDTIIFLHV